ncbi:hypothetical protein ACRAWD_28440 [Caulobacter segnis]
MTDITYTIVEHDGGWAYKVGGTRSPRTFRSHDAALAAAGSAAAEQELPGETEGITYEDKNAVWHGEVADGDDRPTTHVRDAEIAPVPLCFQAPRARSVAPAATWRRFPENRRNADAQARL